MPRAQTLTEVTTTRLTAEQWAWLQAEPGTPGATIRQLIDKAMVGERQPPDHR